jgi:orotate phosphoribosyltransferase
MTDAVETLFVRSGALLEGHFLLKSGRHAGRYLEKFLVLQHPRFGVEVCRLLAVALAPYSPTLVVGPTTGGVLLSFEVARQLGGSVRAAFAEPLEAGGRALRRGWSVAADERVVVVDDILTTGASLVETLDAVRAAGVEPLAAAVMVDRSTAPVELGVPVHAVGRIEIPSWAAGECPLCAEGAPLRKPGSS